VLEATAFQTRDVIQAVKADTGVTVPESRVDGGMTVNSLPMQFQADVLGVDVVRPVVVETTALGAAYAAGLAAGFWSGLDELRAQWREDARWSPVMPRDEAERLHRNWRKAVKRTLDWVDDDVE
jgi:glycerol kinase